MNNFLKTLICGLGIATFSENAVLAQGKYVTDISEVSFFSSTPVEDIAAKNADLKGVIDTETNDFSFRIPIKSFIFDKALMQEHFNENYMESHKFPNSTFKGKMEGNYDLSQDGVYALLAVGNFEIHGVSKQVKLPANIVVDGGLATIQCNFDIALVDYNITVPKVVFYNIAEKIAVKIDAALRMY